MYTTSTSPRTDGSSKLYPGSASVHSRTNQSTRPNVMFGYRDHRVCDSERGRMAGAAPLVLEPSRVSKSRSSCCTTTTCSIRQVWVRCALLLSLAQNSTATSQAGPDRPFEQQLAKQPMLHIVGCSVDRRSASSWSRRK